MDFWANAWDHTEEQTQSQREQDCPYLSWTVLIHLSPFLPGVYHHYEWDCIICRCRPLAFCQFVILDTAEPTDFKIYLLPIQNLRSFKYLCWKVGKKVTQLNIEDFKLGKDDNTYILWLMRITGQARGPSLKLHYFVQGSTLGSRVFIPTVYMWPKLVLCPLPSFRCKCALPMDRTCTLWPSITIWDNTHPLHLVSDLL